MDLRKISKYLYINPLKPIKSINTKSTIKAEVGSFAEVYYPRYIANHTYLERFKSKVTPNKF